MTKSRNIYERHGRRQSEAYSVWCGMWQRCSNPNQAQYKNYGGRGIAIADSWAKFSAFYKDMGDPLPGTFLERKDNNAGYSKDNCIWADWKTQMRNKRTNFLVTIKDETHPLSVWVERCGLRYGTVWQRLRKGWSVEDAIMVPLVTERSGIKRGSLIHKSDIPIVEYGGKQMTLHEAAVLAGLKFDTVYNRLRRGWIVGEALSSPPRKGLRPKLRSEVT